MTSSLKFIRLYPNSLRFLWLFELVGCFITFIINVSHVRGSNPRPLTQQQVLWPLCQRYHEFYWNRKNYCCKTYLWWRNRINTNILVLVKSIQAQKVKSVIIADATVTFLTIALSDNCGIEVLAHFTTHRNWTATIKNKKSDKLTHVCTKKRLA